jgi:hypothetical protein
MRDIVVHHLIALAHAVLTLGTTIVHHVHSFLGGGTIII